MVNIFSFISSLEICILCVQNPHYVYCQQLSYFILFYFHHEKVHSFFPHCVCLMLIFLISVRFYSVELPSNRITQNTNFLLSFLRENFLMPLILLKLFDSIRQTWDSLKIFIMPISAKLIYHDLIELLLYVIFFVLKYFRWSFSKFTNKLR